MDKLTWYDEDGRLYCRRGYEVALARLASYEATGLTPEQCENAKTIIESAFANDTSKAERIRELLKADKNGRLVVLPFSDSDDVEIKRGGITYKSDHWNIHLTAFAENQPTPSGKKVGLFSVEEAAAAMEVNDV